MLGAPYPGWEGFLPHLGGGSCKDVLVLYEQNRLLLQFIPLTVCRFIYIVIILYMINSDVIYSKWTLLRGPFSPFPPLHIYIHTHSHCPEPTDTGWLMRSQTPNKERVMPNRETKINSRFTLEAFLKFRPAQQQLNFTSTSQPKTHPNSIKA